MEITTLCAVVASLRVLPSRSQFFQYDSVSLSCDQLGNSSVWRVMRNTSTKINEECTKSNNTTNDSTCFITDLYPSDSGVYWCESAAGRCSKTIHITVTAGSVILESPAHPVMEGEDVTLTCTSKETSSSNLTAHFYKDRLFIGSSSTGNLTIHRVSKADEGLYKCSISGAGESPDGQLRTIARQSETTVNSYPKYILLPVVGVCLLLVLVLLCVWRSHKVKTSRDVSYTDVTITQEVQPQRIRDTAMDSAETFYSTLNLTTI
ncbi:low affinity immunoglobulin gamma Fc region receptor II-like [Anabas testudineus]|uniref:low affinity immunoglobulin gamma Fc region receptor II-like n=1 Tax=Anabas testudineus TaxID=64144 RepID=UPI000E456652|nr:low affinity immunoglobulin gamma Fc region receptor II-like [Anabas testudineus]